jgi:hypothetical protein
MATVTVPLALMALGTSAATCGTALVVAAEPLLVDVVGVLLELLEHPAATSVVTTAAVRALAASFPGCRRAADTVFLVRLLPI